MTDNFKHVALPIATLMAMIYLAAAALYGSFIAFESAFQAGDAGMIIVVVALAPVVYVLRDWFRDNIDFFKE